MKVYFTKKERHEIYKLAKQHVRKKESMIGYSMCWAIVRAVKDIYQFKTVNVDKIELYFPEFKNLRPYPLAVFWWTTNNLQIRLDNFDKIIKETES